MKMDTIKFENKGEIKMIAHRGVSGLEKENTCPAFVAAGVKSYYGIETDVHVTKDGKYIVIHDDDLQRVAGVDMSVENSTFADLRAVRMKDTDGVTERNDLFLPTLEEYICICRKYDKQAILELKNVMTEEHVCGIVETVKRLGWFSRTTFISFADVNLVYLRKHYADADAQFLTCECGEKEIAIMLENKLDADLCGYCVTPQLVERLHSLGIKVNVWTLDALEHAEMAKAAKVDFITTDILE